MFALQEALAKKITFIELLEVQKFRLRLLRSEAENSDFARFLWSMESANGVRHALVEKWPIPLSATIISLFFRRNFGTFVVLTCHLSNIEVICKLEATSGPFTFFESGLTNYLVLSQSQYEKVEKKNSTAHFVQPEWSNIPNPTYGNASILAKCLSNSLFGASIYLSEKQCINIKRFCSFAVGRRWR